MLKTIPFSDGRVEYRDEIGRLHHLEYRDQQNYPHRIDGPAIKYPNGDSWWFFHGKLHRVNGPAIEIGNSKRWFLEDVEYTKEVYDRLMQLKLYW